MMFSPLICATIIVAINWHCASGDEIHGIDGFDYIERAEFEVLAPHLLKLNKILREKLENQHPAIVRSPERIVDLVEDQLSKGCFGFCLVQNRNKNKAIKLLVSLERTLEQCDKESYEILAKNLIAHHALKYPHLDGLFTMEVLDYYRKQHAKHCRPLIKLEFAEKIKQVPVEALDKVERIFMSLTAFDFNLGRYPSELHKFDLIGMPKRPFALLHSQRALGKVVTLLKAEVEDAAGQRSDSENLKPLFDKHLFEPCIFYRDQLATILDQARFDAAAADDDGQTQKEFLYGDEKFHRALVANRVCDSFLDERQKLYGPLVEAWNKGRDR